MENSFFDKLVDFITTVFFGKSEVGAAQPLSERLATKRLPIDLLAKNMEKDIDEKISHSIKYENLSFLGGYLYAIFDPKDDKNFLLDIKMYFKDSLGKNVLKESSKQVLLDYIDEQSQADLKSKLKLSYPITFPH